MLLPELVRLDGEPAGAAVEANHFGAKTLTTSPTGAKI